MARSNPQKLKKRYACHTAQIVVEGYTEEAFCKHLKTLYARDCGVRVEIHNARGGSPADIVKTALQRRGFDRTFVFFDTDRPLPATWQAKMRGAGHIAVTPTPCVEAFLLELLGHSHPTDTAGCKKRFQKIIPSPAKFTPQAYTRHFPAVTLKGNNHPLLKTLLSVFQLP